MTSVLNAAADMVRQNFSRGSLIPITGNKLLDILCNFATAEAVLHRT